MNTKNTSLISAFALALSAFAFTPAQTEAGEFRLSFGNSCHQPRLSLSFGGNSCRQPYPAYDHTARYRGTYGSFYGGVPTRYHSQRCASYKVCTQEVDRCCHERTACDGYGRHYRYHVTIITYRDVYSDGRCVTYSREYRG